MFKETREGATPAVQFWYFPGEKIGKEFIYPKDQAERIAARTGTQVRTEEGVIEGPGIAAVSRSGAGTEPAPEPSLKPQRREPAPRPRGRRRSCSAGTRASAGRRRDAHRRSARGPGGTPPGRDQRTGST